MDRGRGERQQAVPGVGACRVASRLVEKEPGRAVPPRLKTDSPVARRGGPAGNAKAPEEF
ncbi:hypothetical protein GCM10022630_39800 [Thermobifida alba]